MSRTVLVHSALVSAKVAQSVVGAFLIKRISYITFSALSLLSSELLAVLK
jgi:hypothetical protein